MKTINYHKASPICDHQGNLLFLSNGNILMGYRLDLPESYSLSEKDYERLHNCWFQAFKSLMVHTIIHKQEIYQKKTFQEDLGGTSFLSRATKDYFQDRDYIDHQSFLFFTWPGNKAFHKSGVANPFRSIPRSMMHEMDATANRFYQSVSDAVSYLDNSGLLKLIPLKAEEANQLAVRFFNGFQEDMTCDMMLKTGKLQVGNNWFEVLAVNSEQCFGDAVKTSRTNNRFTADDFQFHQGFIDDLGLELRENHIINQVVYIDDQQFWKQRLNKKREELRKSVNFGTQNKILLEKLEEILDKVNRDEQSRIIRGQLNVIYWDEEQVALKHIQAKIKTALKELDIVPHFPGGTQRYQYYLNSFFGYVTNFSNQDLYVTDLKHALCLWINNSNYRSDKAGIYFNDRIFNLPVLKDVWDEQKRRIKARNFAIFAPTGEGKSFLANNILRQFFEQKMRLVIIDLGGSYSKFAKLYPDEALILRYRQGETLGINPFFIKNSQNLTPDWLEDLSNFLLELFSTGTEMPKAGQVAIKKLLKLYYLQEKEGHSLDNFYCFLSCITEKQLEELKISRKYFDLDSFLHVLSEYVGEGLYSFLFKSEVDQSYQLEDKRMIIFELDEVGENKEILSVMLKLIKSAIQRTIWRNRAERGIILFDEFAKQLKFKNVLESVEYYYQAIRKQNGAIGIILQSINQLPENSTSASIMENTQVIYSLHNEKGYADLQRRLNLSSHDLNQLRSIRNNLKGSRRYTEMFIKIGKESNVFRLEVPPEVYAAYLTDGSENERLLSLFNQLGDMEKAIKEFIKTQKS